MTLSRPARPHLYTIVAGAILLAACTDRPAKSGADDTTVVSDSVVHGDTLRITIHREASSDTTTLAPSDLTLDQPFGQVVSIAAIADGGVLVFDQKWESGPSLLRFSATGALVGKIGREGEGPGEYGAPSGGIQELQDGVVLLHARSLSRVNLYDPLGQTIGQVRVPSLQWVRGGPIPLDDGTIGIPAVVASDSVRVAVVVRITRTGEILDTLVAPPLEYPIVPTTEFAPVAFWSILPDGRSVTALSDRIGITIREPGTGASVIESVIDGTRPPAHYLAEERDAQDRYYDWIMTYGAGDYPEGRPTIPESKQELVHVTVDVEGRIWLRRTSESVRVDRPPRDTTLNFPPEVPYVERARFIGFANGGAYLGELELPVGFGVESFRGDHVWVLRRSSEGESVVSRHRLPWR